MKTAREPWNERASTDNSGTSASKIGISFSRVGIALGPAINSISAVDTRTTPVVSFVLFLSKGIQKVQRRPRNDHRFCIELQDLRDFRGDLWPKPNYSGSRCKSSFFLKGLTSEVRSSGFNHLKRKKIFILAREFILVGMLKSLTLLVNVSI